MPRKTKETNEKAIEPVKSTKKRTTSTEKTDSKSVVAKSTIHKTSSKAATKSTSKSSKNSTAKSAVKKTSSKTAATKTSSKSTTANKISKTASSNSKSTVKASKASKKTSTKTDSSTKRISKKVANSKKEKASKVVEKPAVIEYYDLPYRYNKTMVKVLAQTPTTLFVYWDISDEDKANYVKQYKISGDIPEFRKL